jgi:hypothetical protein
MVMADGGAAVTRSSSHDILILVVMTLQTLWQLILAKALFAPWEGGICPTMRDTSV